MHNFHPRPHLISVGLFVLAHVVIIVSAPQLAKLSQPLEARFVIVEFLFHIIVSSYDSSITSLMLHAEPPQILQIQALFVDVEIIVLLVSHIICFNNYSFLISIGNLPSFLSISIERLGTVRNNLSLALLIAT